MRTTTQRLMLRGTVIVGFALAVSAVGGWVRRATADNVTLPEATVPAADVRGMEQTLDQVQGELTVAKLQLERATAIIGFSSKYGIPADLASNIYDMSSSEGVDPVLAFRLVRVESGFDPRAKSRAGAIGLTQVLPSTARLYEPGLSVEQLYEPATNLRLGFRYLHDLMARYGTLNHALVAYNSGPGK
ncbi:MAG TPA: lytic transglycosylase domain-containing protein, partial [Gemmatimonadales bacterium]|nr:lytic transglycosylase domain-containing protein [Gemmatimonadales bacterium]